MKTARRDHSRQRSYNDELKRSVTLLLWALQCGLVLLSWVTRVNQMWVMTWLI